MLTKSECNNKNVITQTSLCSNGHCLFPVVSYTLCQAGFELPWPSINENVQRCQDDIIPFF